MSELAFGVRVHYLTQGGIPGIGHIPFGVHLCHFYESRQDLIDILLPYLSFGLRNRERCIWVTAPPVSTEVARTELTKWMRDSDDFVAAGGLWIVDSEAWFARPRGGDEREGWRRAEQSALAQGYAGLRIAGTVGCAEHWTSRIEREAAASAALADRRIVALCGYDATRLGLSEVREVMRKHDYTLRRSHGSWCVVEPP